MPVLPRLIRRAPPLAVKPTVDSESSLSSPAADFSELQRAEEKSCRLCWDTEHNNEPGGELISPCACSGSLKYIHRRCLADWQRTQRSQGQGRRANTCELCKAVYQLPEHQQQAGQQLSVHRRLLTSVSNALFDALYATSWPALAMRLWRSYVMAQGIAQALKLGVSGFSAGLSIGKSLIEEQASLLNGMLSYTSGFLGSPYAEMIWCQAVGALFVGMLSELVYTSILGLLGGLAYGFCTGYVSAIKGSVRLMSGVSCRAMTAAACLLARVLKGAAGLLARAV